MTEINRRFFDSLMADKKLSLRALAAKMDMSHSQLSLTFNGQRRMTLDEATKISQIFNVPIHEVISATGVSMKPISGQRVQVVGTVSGDGTVSQVDGIERTTAPPGLPDNVIAIQFRTAGSALDWTDGWVSFCKKPNGVDPVIGSVCYFQIKGGASAVGLLRRGYKEDTYNACGPYYQESVALDFATPLLITRN